jgi:hypothetical protein
MVTVVATVVVSALVASTAAASASGAEQDRRVVEGLELRVPTAWSSRPLLRRCRHLGRGMLVANVASRLFRRDDPEGTCSNYWNIEDAPRHFVLLDLSRFDGPPVVGPARADSRFPLTLGSLKRSSWTDKRGLASRCSCIYRHGELWLDGLYYNLRVWVGREASNRDRRLLMALLGSIQPVRS